MSPIEDILRRSVPPGAAEYCVGLADRFKFMFKLKRRRTSKVGDFHAPPGQPAMITLNNDMNPHIFLITYIHEVAHHRIYVQYGHRVPPHGLQWKHCFQELITPLLTENIFPSELLPHLSRHMANPKATTFSDVHLTRALRKYDSDDKLKSLSDLEPGARFMLHRRVYRRGVVRRTRILCSLVGTRRKYLISSEARVLECD